MREPSENCIAGRIRCAGAFPPGAVRSADY